MMWQDSIIKACIVAVLVMWGSVLLIPLVLKIMKKKIVGARKKEDIGRSQYLKIKKLSKSTTRAQKFLKILLFFECGLLIIRSTVRTLHFFHESTSVNVSIGELFLIVVDIQLFLSVLGTIGAIVIAKMLLRYYEIAIRKCVDLGLEEENK